MAQKRSSLPYQLQYAPVPLSRDFPVHYWGIYRQTDRKIVYLHRHDCLEIGYCHQGSGVFVVENKVFTYGSGDVNVIGPSEMHLARSTPGTESQWTFIMLDPAALVGPSVNDPSLLEVGSLAGSRFRNIMASADHPALVACIRQIVQEMADQGPHYRSAVRSLVWTLMILLHRLPDRQPVASAGDAGLERIAASLQWMARNYAQPMAIDELAEVCHLSPAHFRRLFLQKVGQSPLAYLNALRVRMAAIELQQSGRQVVDIAWRTGFGTISSFNRQFKVVMGCSPRDWRRRGK